MPDQNESQVEFEELTRAIDAFETKKATILQKAFEEGGADLVVQLVNEVEALKDTRFELLRAQLDHPILLLLIWQSRPGLKARPSNAASGGYRRLPGFSSASRVS
jgi:hypothetical protein